MFPQAYNIIIGLVFSAPGYDVEVVDGFNSVDKTFILRLMATAQLPYSKIDDTYIAIYSATHTDNVSLAQ